MMIYRIFGILNPLCMFMQKIALLWHNFARYCTNKKDAIFYASQCSNYGSILLFQRYIRRRKKFDDKCSRLDTIPECEGRTDRRTDGQNMNISLAFNMNACEQQIK